MFVSKLPLKLITTAVAVFMGTCLPQASCAAPSASGYAYGPRTLDETAAIVNNDIILESELDSAQAEVIRNFRSRGTQVSPLTARRAALEQLVTRSIALQQGRQLGLNLTDTQVDQALAQSATQSNRSVESILRSYGNVSTAKARQMFAEDLVINEVRSNQVRRRVRISDAEVDLLAKSLRTLGNVEPSYHLAQLVLPLDARASASEVNRVGNIAMKIKRDAQNGVDFNSLVAQYAQGSTAAQGGDLGYILESQVPVPFLPALLKADEGAVLGPFRSPFGLHLLKLYDVVNQAVEPITTYKARHILLTTSVIFSDQAAVSQLTALRSRILNKEISFAKAAKQFSEDPGSAALGGDLGYAPASRYDPAFAQAMVALHPGSISQPIRSSFGWHLIYLEDRRIDRSSDEAFKQRARELIYRRLYQEESQAWERELRATSYVHVTDKTLLEAGLEDSINSNGNPRDNKL